MIKRTYVPFSKRIKIAANLCLVVIVIEVINQFTGGFFRSFGIIPRNISGLGGIVFAPFLHSGLIHLFSNIVPLFILTLLLLGHGLTRFILVFSSTAIIGGLLVWFLGRDANHIGISGVIYGLFGYLVVAGFISREFKLLMISCLVAFMYGGLIFGILPILPQVSFESHLFGLIIGIIMAFILGKDPSYKTKITKQ
ncbi:MAG: membrane associated rhomboid family serine protease [Oleispira sp.]|jgi:membrane associated rhomboid family serine protease